ncbi:MAG: hypothetical protein HY984_02495 [Candidatus Magasanikbacteria bacterium]|nr:hypothetical protein [Candidatus Magasanikbacteria bacterium]
MKRGIEHLAAAAVAGALSADCATPSKSVGGQGERPAVEAGVYKNRVIIPFEEDLSGTRQKNRHPGTGETSRPVGPEGKELPEGAEDRDPYGEPYGWAWQNQYEYVSEEDGIPPEDLSEPFDGRSRNGALIEDKLRLRKEAYAEWQTLCAEFEKAGKRNAILREMGCFLTEGYRTRSDQVKL